MDAIYRAIEAAHFHGRLVVVNYYSLDYGDAAGTGLTQLLNKAITSHAKADGARMRRRIRPHSSRRPPRPGGHTCEAGLAEHDPWRPADL